MYLLGNLLKEGGYFSVPCLLAESERLANMTVSSRLVAKLFYDVLHRVSSPRFYAKDVTLCRAFCLDPKTLRKAFAEMERVQLLRRVAGKRGATPTEYWLCHPVTGEPLPEQDGRVTPTFNGFSKANRRLGTAHPVKHPSVALSAHQESRKPTRSRIVFANSEGVVSNPTGPSERTQIQPKSTQPGRLCHIKVHNTIHYRVDGSAVCGDCHPTGITHAPDKNSQVAEGTSRDFGPPTAKELGFSS